MIKFDIAESKSKNELIGNTDSLLRTSIDLSSYGYGGSLQATLPLSFPNRL